jgi:hypothetical protein
MPDVLAVCHRASLTMMQRNFFPVAACMLLLLNAVTDSLLLYGCLLLLTAGWLLIVDCHVLLRSYLRWCDG